MCLQAETPSDGEAEGDKYWFGLNVFVSPGCVLKLNAGINGI